MGLGGGGAYYSGCCQCRPPAEKQIPQICVELHAFLHRLLLGQHRLWSLFTWFLVCRRRGAVPESKALYPPREKLYWTLESNFRRCPALTPFQGSLSYEAGSTDDRILLEVKCDSMGINMTV